MSTYVRFCMLGGTAVLEILFVIDTFFSILLVNGAAHDGGTC